MIRIKRFQNASKLTGLVAMMFLLALAACAASEDADATATAPAATMPPATRHSPLATLAASEDADSTPTAPVATPAATRSASEDANSARRSPPATRPSPPATPPATPTTASPATLSAHNCPTPTETYRNEVMGIELPVPDGHRIVEPQYLFAEYGVALVGPGESAFQAIWLYQRTPEALEAIVAEQLAQLADLPTTRAPLVVAGVEGVMLSPVPGIVAHTAVYLPVDGRLFLLLAPSAPLDDAGRCWLAGARFFPPTKTLAELRLPTDSGVPAAPTPVLPAATLPADTTTWAEYRNDTYGFSFRYPDGRWTLVEPTADNPHRLALAYHELGIALRVAVARAGEDANLQLYGGRAGDFVPGGEVLFLGEPVSRSALVYQGVTWAVYFNDTRPIAHGDLLFSVALVSNRDFEQGAVVPEEVQAEAERILETFVVGEP